jgi:hypothetical protein
MDLIKLERKNIPGCASDGEALAQHEFMVARKLVQLRDQIDQQVLQLRQDVIAFGHAIFLKKIPPLRGLAKGLKHKRAKTKAPSHNGTQRRRRHSPGGRRRDRRTARRWRR